MSKSGNAKVIVGCIQCGKEREITRQQIRRTKYTGLCAHCSRDSRKGETHPSWRGGQRLGGQNGDYMTIHKPEHPFANKGGYVLQHRLVAEDILGRYLYPEEIPHHLNGDTKDNCWSNIIVLSNQSSHAKLHKHLEHSASIYQQKIGALIEEIDGMIPTEFRDSIRWADFKATHTRKEE